MTPNRMDPTGDMRAPTVRSSVDQNSTSSIGRRRSLANGNRSQSKRGSLDNPFSE